MKIDGSKSEEGSRSRRNMTNGEASHSDESPKDSNKRSRSRSKSPRNTLCNGELMFDAALYAPERPKRNRKKPEEEIFTPVKPVVPRQQPKKRKAPEKQIKKKPEPTKTTPKSSGSKRKSLKGSKEEELDVEQPRSKRKCVKKIQPELSEDEEDDDMEEEPQEEKPKPTKATNKTTKQTKATPKATPKGKPKPAPTPTPTKKASASKEKEKPSVDRKTRNATVTPKNKKEKEKKTSCAETSEDESPKPKASASKPAAKPKKKPPPVKTPDIRTSTPKGGEKKTKPRNNKQKKSPAKIEIDGIEITELSDLNSSREDDFNSSRDSINNVSNNDNETSVETVIYEDSSGARTAADKTENGTSKSPCKTEHIDSTDSKPIDENSSLKSPPTSSSNAIPPSAANSSSHVSPVMKAEVTSSPSKADTAPTQLTNHTGSSSHPLYAQYPPSSHDTQSHQPHQLQPKPLSQPPQEVEKKLPCTQPGCKYIGKSGVLLRKHLRNHNIFMCAHCNFNGNQFEALEMHMKEEHPTRWGRKKCQKCCRHIRLDLHAEHEATCNGEKVWKCDECDIVYPHESLLKEHRKKHNRQPRYECQFCDFKVESKPLLKSHFETDHPDKSPTEYICDQCTTHRHFFSRVMYEAHLKMHDDVNNGRSFLCTLCSKTFKSEQSLISHKNTIHNVQELMCNVEGCGETFRTLRLLGAHRKQIHSLPPQQMFFKCEHEGCGMEFQKKSQLNKHVGMHTGQSLHMSYLRKYNELSGWFGFFLFHSIQYKCLLDNE